MRINSNLQSSLTPVDLLSNGLRLESKANIEGTKFSRVGAAKVSRVEVVRAEWEEEDDVIP